MILQPPIIHPLSGYKLLMFDADGTLRHCTVPGQPCPNRAGEWVLMPHVRDCLSTYTWDILTQLPGRCFGGIVSNQGGVALGYLTWAEALELLAALRDAVFERYWPDAILLRLCPHAPGARCICRTPHPLLLCNIMHHVSMALEERHELALQTSDVLYVGDMASDREAAERAGIDFCFAGDFFGWGDPEPTALDAARSQFAAGDAPEEEDREHGKSFPAEEGLR